MSLLTDGTNYLLQPNGGTTVKLSYNGAPVTVGQFGGWTPVAAAQTATGYEVAFEAGGLRSIYDVEHSTAAAITSRAPSTRRWDRAPSWNRTSQLSTDDLNGDGTIGIPAASLTAIESSGSTSLLTDGTDFFLRTCWRVADSAEL